MSSRPVVASLPLLLLLSLPSPIIPTTWYLKEPFTRFKSAEKNLVCALDGIDLSTSTLDRTCIEGTDLAQIYCYGKILEAINYHHKTMLFQGDSKHFVDRPLKKPAHEIVQNFKQKFNVSAWKDFKVTKMTDAQVKDLETFVRDNFAKADGLLEKVTPKDWQEKPPKFERIKDKDFKKWAYELNELWKELGKKVPEKMKDDSTSTLIYVSNPFVVPGGRFREFYYWDAYWIVRGLLASGMVDSVRYMCENFAEMVESFGFVPNGGRIYYNKRSQPPFLTFMVYDYFAATGDMEFLKKVLPTLEKEINFWRTKRSVQVLLNGRDTTFYQYRAESNVPRPESFCADVDTVKDIPKLEDKAKVWREMASAAESGWDFSSRWIEEDVGSKEPWKLTRLMITSIVPVDLNALICGNFEMLAHLFLQIGDKTKAAQYHNDFQTFREDVQNLFYSDGGWFDYNLKTGKLNKKYYASIVVPLFARCYHAVDVEETERMFAKLEQFDNVLTHPFGVPTSTINTEQQWDFPNIWPPLAHMLVESLRRSGSQKMEEKAKEIARRWVSANYELYTSCGQHMWEKIAADNGNPGIGGEYIVQIGFGWANGGVLDLLVTYGDEITKLPGLPEVKETSPPPPLLTILAELVSKWTRTQPSMVMFINSHKHLQILRPLHHPLGITPNQQPRFDPLPGDC
uniref:Trehalase n=1 Tax=Globodera rostochiensis TaxID=31243 RepID=A0A914HN57_GLORO